MGCTTSKPAPQQQQHPQKSRGAETCADVSRGGAEVGPRDQVAIDVTAPNPPAAVDSDKGPKDGKQPGSALLAAGDANDEEGSTANLNGRDNGGRGGSGDSSSATRPVVVVLGESCTLYDAVPADAPPRTPPRRALGHGLPRRTPPVSGQPQRPPARVLQARGWSIPPLSPSSFAMRSASYPASVAETPQASATGARPHLRLFETATGGSSGGIANGSIGGDGPRSDPLSCLVESLYRVEGRFPALDVPPATPSAMEADPALRLHSSIRRSGTWSMMRADSPTDTTDVIPSSALLATTGGGGGGTTGHSFGRDGDGAGWGLDEDDDEDAFNDNDDGDSRKPPARTSQLAGASVPRDSFALQFNDDDTFDEPSAAGSTWIRSSESGRPAPAPCDLRCSASDFRLPPSMTAAASTATDGAAKTTLTQQRRHRYQESPQQQRRRRSGVATGQGSEAGWSLGAEESVTPSRHPGLDAMAAAVGGSGGAAPSSSFYEPRRSRSGAAPGPNDAGTAGEGGGDSLRAVISSSGDFFDPAGVELTNVWASGSDNPAAGARGGAYNNPEAENVEDRGAPLVSLIDP